MRGGRSRDKINLTLNVRQATNGDFEAWFTLFDAVACEQRWIGREGPLDRETCREAFGGYVASENTTTLLVESDGRLVGTRRYRGPAGASRDRHDGRFRLARPRSRIPSHGGVYLVGRRARVPQSRFRYGLTIVLPDRFTSSSASSKRRPFTGISSEER